MVKKTFTSGTGKRKTACAQVRLMPGNGAIVVDGIPFEERFTRIDHRQIIIKPFTATDTTGRYDAIVTCDGGGIAGQASAISLGIARALLKEDEKNKPLLRAEGLLTRDSRAKERKKPGLKRARKAPQYTKR
jgi:small subunit ribosomal protein S9